MSPIHYYFFIEPKQIIIIIVQQNQLLSNQKVIIVDPTNCHLVYVLFAQEILQPFYCKSQDPLVVVAVMEKNQECET